MPSMKHNVDIKSCFEYLFSYIYIYKYLSLSRYINIYVKIFTGVHFWHNKTKM